MRRCCSDLDDKFGRVQLQARHHDPPARFGGIDGVPIAEYDVRSNVCGENTGGERVPCSRVCMCAGCIVHCDGARQECRQLSGGSFPSWDRDGWIRIRSAFFASWKESLRHTRRHRTHCQRSSNRQRCGLCGSHKLQAHFYVSHHGLEFRMHVEVRLRAGRARPTPESRIGRLVAGSAHRAHATLRAQTASSNTTCVRGYFSWSGPVRGSRACCP